MVGILIFKMNNLLGVCAVFDGYFHFVAVVVFEHVGGYFEDVDHVVVVEFKRIVYSDVADADCGGYLPDSEEAFRIIARPRHLEEYVGYAVSVCNCCSLQQYSAVWIFYFEAYQLLLYWPVVVCHLCEQADL